MDLLPDAIVWFRNVASGWRQRQCFEITSQTRYVSKSDMRCNVWNAASGWRQAQCFEITRQTQHVKIRCQTQHFEIFRQAQFSVTMRQTCSSVAFLSSCRHRWRQTPLSDYKLDFPDDRNVFCVRKNHPIFAQYLWSPWAHKSRSPIKICRILQGNLSNCFEYCRLDNWNSISIFLTNTKSLILVPTKCNNLFYPKGHVGNYFLFFFLLLFFTSIFFLNEGKIKVFNMTFISFFLKGNWKVIGRFSGYTTGQKKEGL